MGYILPEIYKAVCQETGQQLPKIFIETGTFKGGIPHRILENFKTLDEAFKEYYTVELSLEICKIASKRYQYFEKGEFEHHKIHTDEADEKFKDQQEYFGGKLTLINNDSVEALTKLIPLIEEPICFWLDAHAGAQKYARGSVDVPLLQELECIKNSKIKNHIIAIDDAHLFGKKEYDKTGNLICDYQDVSYEVVKEKILEINSKYDIGIYAPYGMKMLLAFVKPSEV